MDELLVIRVNYEKTVILRIIQYSFFCEAMKNYFNFLSIQNSFFAKL